MDSRRSRARWQSQEARQLRLTFEISGARCNIKAESPFVNRRILHCDDNNREMKDNVRLLQSCLPFPASSAVYPLLSLNSDTDRAIRLAHDQASQDLSCGSSLDDAVASFIEVL